MWKVCHKKKGDVCIVKTLRVDIVTITGIFFTKTFTASEFKDIYSWFAIMAKLIYYLVFRKKRMKGLWMTKYRQAAKCGIYKGLIENDLEISSAVKYFYLNEKG